jgi:hypothetical protein
MDRQDAPATREFVGEIGKTTAVFALDASYWPELCALCLNPELAMMAAILSEA